MRVKWRMRQFESSIAFERRIKSFLWVWNFMSSTKMRPQFPLGAILEANSQLHEFIALQWLIDVLISRTRWLARCILMEMAIYAYIYNWSIETAFFRCSRTPVRPLLFEQSKLAILTAGGNRFHLHVTFDADHKSHRNRWLAFERCTSNQMLNTEFGIASLKCAVFCTRQRSKRNDWIEIEFDSKSHRIRIKFGSYGKT